jgi:hypothetical protein
METLNESTHLFLKPIFIGLYIGLALCLVIFIREKIQNRKLKKELRNLKQHIQTKLEIDAEANEKRKSEFERLKNENENLRITLQSYYEKPGRKEIRQLHLYQKAVEILIEKAPGFAQSWQSVLRDSEEEIRKTERGIIPFIKKLLPGSTLKSKFIENRTDPSAKQTPST